jgi:putative oxidoreductase
MEDRFFNAAVNNRAVAGPGLLVGRLFMAVLFLTFGINKAVNTPQIQQYMAAHHVPVQLVYLTIVVQIGFGALVALGYHTRFAAMMLAGFCIIATSLFHADFSMPGELAHFLKDFAIAGGFLFMIAHGPGPLSLDAYLGRTPKAAKLDKLYPSRSL